MCYGPTPDFSLGSRVRSIRVGSAGWRACRRKLQLRHCVPLPVSCRRGVVRDIYGAKSQFGGLGSPLLPYLNLLERLHELDFDSEAADVVRDRMEGFWYYMPQDMQELASAYSAALHVLSGDLPDLDFSPEKCAPKETVQGILSDVKRSLCVP